MSDDTTISTEAPAMDPVQITLELPGRLHRDYSRLAELGLYMSVEEAIRQTVLTAWRFERGSYHTLRLDIDGVGDDSDGEKADQDAPT